VRVQITARCLKDQGKSTKQIARDLQLSRNTVRRYLRHRTTSDYPARPAKPNALLEPFAPDIEAMPAEELIGSRILAELRKRGYRGPKRTSYRYLARLTAERSPSPAVERFETGPARQGQYDWSLYTVPVSGAATRVYPHSFIERGVSPGTGRAGFSRPVGERGPDWSARSGQDPFGHRAWGQSLRGAQAGPVLRRICRWTSRGPTSASSWSAGAMSRTRWW